MKTNLIKNVPDLTDFQSRENAHQEYVRATVIAPEKAVEKFLKPVKVRR